MKPTGLLMEEHRLIERMLALMEAEARRIAADGAADLRFVETGVDFIRMYADKTHHGKEEDILFRDMARKELSSRHRELLQELLDDHNFGRRTVGELAEAGKALAGGEGGALETIREKLETLTAFYHDHIQKEDDIFFPASLEYLSEQEDVEMIREFRDADRKMIHFKYTAVVEGLEQA